MHKLITRFERFIVSILLILMALVVTVSTVDLAVLIIREIFSSSEKPWLFLDINELATAFGFFFNILIGLELFETVKLYLKENVFHAEIILLVGLIAVSRKVIVLDYKNADAMVIISMALLIASMTAGYYFLRKGNSE